MSQEAVLGRARKVYLAAWVLLPILVLGGILYYLVRDSRVDTDTKGPQEREQENFLAQARTTLSRQADLATCRTVVQQLNAHLQQAKEHTVPPVADPARLK